MQVGPRNRQHSPAVYPNSLLSALSCYGLYYYLVNIFNMGILQSDVNFIIHYNANILLNNSELFLARGF